MDKQTIIKKARFFGANVCRKFTYKNDEYTLEEFIFVKNAFILKFEKETNTHMQMRIIIPKDKDMLRDLEIV